MKQFNTVTNGYDKDEVNGFVEEVTKEYESVLQKLRQSEIENKALKERIDYYKNIETTLNTAVLVAEDSSNEIRKIAKEDAKLIVEQAKKEAERIKEEYEQNIEDLKKNSLTFLQVEELH